MSTAFHAVDLEEFNETPPLPRYLDRANQSDWVVSLSVYSILFLGLLISLLLLDHHVTLTFPPHSVTAIENLSIHFRHVLHASAPIPAHNFRLLLQLSLTPDSPPFVPLSSEVKSLAVRGNGHGAWASSSSLPSPRRLRGSETDKVAILELNDGKLYDTFHFLVAVGGPLNFASLLRFSCVYLSPDCESVIHASRLAVAWMILYGLLSGGADFSSLALAASAVLYAQPWHFFSQKVKIEQVWLDSLFVSALRLFFFVQSLPLADDRPRAATVVVFCGALAALAVVEGAFMQAERLALLAVFNVVFAQVIMVVSASVSKKADASSARTAVAVTGEIALSIAALICVWSYGVAGRFLANALLGAFVGATAALMIHLFRRVGDAPTYQNLQAIEDDGEVNSVVN
jgi:hypothetical protein